MLVIPRASAEGLVNLIDNIQDQAAEIIGEDKVFDPYDPYPKEDWQYDVANGDTKLGYEEWVEHNIESHKK
jgi:hypothetical protein